MVTRGEAFGFPGRRVYVEKGTVEPPDQFRINLWNAFEIAAEAADGAVERYLIRDIIRLSERPGV